MRKNKIKNKFIPHMRIFILGAVILYSVAYMSPVYAQENSSTTTDSIATSTEPIAEKISDPIRITLHIETINGALFNDILTVSACSTSSSTPASVNGYCAIQQSGLENEWSSWGDDLFLSSVGGITNDDTSGTYWGWFSNLEYGQSSLNTHILSADEQLLITLGKMPLKISVSTTSPTIFSTTTPELFGTTTITVNKFGFDDAWNAVWLPAASSSIVISGEFFDADSQGTYELRVSTDIPLEVHAELEGFVPSASVHISPYIVIESSAIETPVITSTSTPEEPSIQENNQSSGGTIRPPTHHSLDVPKAIEFLLSKQKDNGSFGSDIYTDWAAIALAAGPSNSGKSKVAAYLKEVSDSLKSVTDYERRAMALMALDINPYTGTSINYIQKIVDEFDGTQIGDDSLVNDDIFAIFPLVKSGYSEKDSIIKKIIQFIISEQKTNGSWENSVDLTAAGVQALASMDSISGVKPALVSAREFLKSHQQSDGGFGSSFSTSWAIQAIVALGESVSAWNVNNANPFDAQYESQQIDGGVEDISSSESTRIWATAYAIPAALGKPWADILHSFSKGVLVEEQSVQTNNSIDENSAQPATTTIEFTEMIASTTAVVFAEETPLVPDREQVVAENSDVLRENANNVIEEENLTGQEIKIEETSQTASVVNADEFSPKYMALIVGFVLFAAFGLLKILIKKYHV